ncbi:MAG: glycine cleavage T C-terminal barrel domain-containing protein, partial [Burkholderiales bacterium]
LRLEKGYRAWGSDIGPDHTPLEAGLAWAVKLKKDIPFLGHEALRALQNHLLKKRLVCFTVDDAAIVLLGRETIYRDGERVGWLSSAGWGYTVNKNIGYGYVRRAEGVSDEWLQSGNYRLEVASEHIAATLHASPLYDPASTRVRG